MSFIDRAMTTDSLIGHGYTNLLIVCTSSYYILQAINSTLFTYIVNNSHINVMDCWMLPFYRSFLVLSEVIVSYYKICIILFVEVICWGTIAML